MLSEELVKKLDELKEEMTELQTEPKVETKPTKSTAKKKAVKKAETKKADGGISPKTLAKEAKIEPRVARRKLRKAKLEPDGRWSWEAGSAALKAARKALGLT